MCAVVKLGVGSRADVQRGLLCGRGWGFACGRVLIRWGDFQKLPIGWVLGSGQNSERCVWLVKGFLRVKVGGSRGSVDQDPVVRALFE